MQISYSLMKTRIWNLWKLISARFHRCLSPAQAGRGAAKDLLFQPRRLLRICFLNPAAPSPRIAPGRRGCNAVLPKLEASIRIYLFQGEPEFVSSNWPSVLRDADALGKQAIKLAPGEEASTISTSCLLNPDVTMALIAVSANTRSGGSTPIPLGGYFVDDVQLTAIKQPILPVRFVK